MAIVKYNRASMMGIQHSEKPATKENPAPAMTEHMLLAGVNDIPDEKWDVLSQHPTVKALIEDGTIEVDGAMSKEGAFGKSKDAAAIKMVGETIDQALLTKWAASEKRPKVKAAIEARQAALKPGTPNEELEKVTHPQTQEDRVQTKGANLNP